MRKSIWIGVGLVVALVVAAAIKLRPDLAIRVATGLVSHEIYSGVFVSGLKPEAIFAENLTPRPFFSLVAWALAYQVDREHRATATFLGGDQSRAAIATGSAASSFTAPSPPTRRDRTCRPTDQHSRC